MAAKPNPFVRAGKYFSAWFGAKVDEHADPKVQIQQAIEEAQRQHQALTQQAASVIGNQRQLEMKLDRQLNQVESLHEQTRQALVLADNARAAGDTARAAEFEETAQALANQLIGAERGVEDLKGLHDQALQAAAQARDAVRTNATLLEEKLAQRTRLLSQLEQAKMQEQVSASLNQMSELAAPSNVPRLDEVGDKIERRYATALGQADLASATPAARMMEVKQATADLRGAARLAEIRASMQADAAALPGSAASGTALPGSSPSALGAGAHADDPTPASAPGTASLPSEQGADSPGVSTEKRP